MRFESAVVLSTIAVGQAAAAHNRHASFHARREASKRGADADWKNVAYDLKNVNWSKDVDWNSVFAKTPVAAQPTPATPQEKKPAPVVASPTPEPKHDDASTPVEASSAKPTKSSKAAEPAEKSKSPVEKIVEEVTGDLMSGVESIAAIVNAQIGVNSKTPTSDWWIGSSGASGYDVTNNGNEDAVWFCWVFKVGEYSSMALNANKPAISVGVKKGQTVSVSLAPGASGACAGVTASVGKSTFGGLKAPWAEMTAPGNGNNFGTFNVSANPAMKGCALKMEGSTCKSDNVARECVFECKDKTVDSCMHDYELVNCDAKNGGGQGYDPIMAGVGGGCTMPTKGDRIKVSFAY